MVYERPYDELERFELSPGRRLWRKFLRNPVGAIGGVILLTVVTGAIFAERIAPHEPNRQRLIALFGVTVGVSRTRWGRTRWAATSGAVSFTVAGSP